MVYAIFSKNSHVELEQYWMFFMVWSLNLAKLKFNKFKRSVWMMNLPCWLLVQKHDGGFQAWRFCLQGWIAPWDNPKGCTFMWWFSKWLKPLVVWNIFYFPIYWEFHHPNWLSLHHFSEGLVQTTNQIITIVEEHHWNNNGKIRTLCILVTVPFWVYWTSP